MIEADGMLVMERDKPCPGSCEGREVKQAVLYPLAKPKQRHYLASAEPIAFALLVHGLRCQQGMKQQDNADGAPWLDERTWASTCVFSMSFMPLNTSHP